ncbi:MAG: TIGR03618 family F420-dependent PPOX class oxidoreductase [Dehalococcoidia bacterium]
MSDEQRDQFLAQANVAVLASVATKGGAHAAPIWYLYENGEFLMSTGKGSQKHRNLEANPEVTLVVDRRTVPYYAVMARGSVELGPGLDLGTRRRIASRYLTEQQLDAYMASAAGGESVAIRLRPRKLIEFHGRAGRSG